MCSSDLQEAPQDRRILLKTRVRLSPTRFGTKWVEARFIGGQWREWSGCPKRVPALGLSPLGWLPHPEEEKAA